MTLYPQDSQHWPFHPHEILSRWMGHTAPGESLTGEQKGRGRVLLVTAQHTHSEPSLGVGVGRARQRKRQKREKDGERT